VPGDLADEGIMCSPVGILPAIQFPSAPEYKVPKVSKTRHKREGGGGRVCERDCGEGATKGTQHIGRDQEGECVREGGEGARN